MLQRLASFDAPADTALNEVAAAFAVTPDPHTVLDAAFTWYYMPLAADRRAYADRVVAHVLAGLDPSDSNTLPDWFWRVYDLTVRGVALGGTGIAPPPDPR